MEVMEPLPTIAELLVSKLSCGKHDSSAMYSRGSDTYSRGSDTCSSGEDSPGALSPNRYQNTDYCNMDAVSYDPMQSMQYDNITCLNNLELTEVLYDVEPVVTSGEYGQVFCNTTDNAGDYEYVHEYYSEFVHGNNGNHGDILCNTISSGGSNYSSGTEPSLVDEDSNSSVELPLTKIVCSQSGLPNFSTITPRKASPSKRGRPVTYNKPGHPFRDTDIALSSSSDEDVSYSEAMLHTRCKRGAKNILLWKFLLDELRKHQAHIKWENERSGTFKFVDTMECSRRWGQMKKKGDMNFEKLSRGIRHYYRDGLMSRKNGIRLVYQFHWDRVPRAYRPRH